MTEQRRCVFSLIEFRRNPAVNDEKPIHLGAVIGFTTDRCHVVGLAMRETISDHRLENLDPLSQSMIESRAKIFETEIREILDQDRGSSPQEILQALANNNPWSLNVTAPATLSVDIEEGATGSIEAMAQEYVFTLYSRRIFSTIPRSAHTRPYGQERASAVTPNAAETDQSAKDDYEPGWMVPPKTWSIPFQTN